MKLKHFIESSIAMLLAAPAFSQNVSFAQTPDSNFFIYLGFGQSNMQGKGVIEYRDRDINGKNFGKDSWDRYWKLIVYDYDKSKIGTWATALPPIVRPDTGLGPTDYFGRYLVTNLNSMYKIGVAVVAVDGASIQAFDTDSTTAASYITKADSWVVNAGACYDNYPYGKLVEMGRIAQKSGVIKGIIFHQGESDVTGATQASANLWYQRVTKIYRSILEDLNLSADSVPFIAGEPLYSEKGGACGSAVQWVDKLPDYMNREMGTKCCYVVSASNLDAMDQYHFTSGSYRILGNRYGKIALEILHNQGIAGVFTSQTDEGCHSIFNLNGQALDAPQQGLNIIDGRKYYMTF